jgi:hypothetical protein
MNLQDSEVQPGSPQDADADPRTQYYEVWILEYNIGRHCCGMVRTAWAPSEPVDGVRKGDE